MRYLLFFIAFFTLLLGRENPFVVSDMNEDTIQATNIKSEYNDFSKKEINLPSHARIIKNIIVEYQALDGSLEQKKVVIDRRFDWHDPLVLSVKEILPVMPDPIIQKNDLLIKEKTNPSLKKQKINSLKSKISISKNLNLQKIKHLSRKFGDFFRFDVKGRTLRIRTKDVMKRDFSISKPYKLVFDFAGDKTFYTKTLKIGKPPFVSVTFGSHEGYYRVAFLLDGPYPYNLSKQEEDLLIELR